MSKSTALISKQRILEADRIDTGSHGRHRQTIHRALGGAKHGVEIVVRQREGVHGAWGWYIRLAVAVVALRQSSKSRVTVERMRTRDLVGRARDMGRVVVTVAGLMMTVREDGQLALRVRRRQLRFRACVMECLAARVKLEVKRFLLYDSAYTLTARVTLAGMTRTVMS